MPREYMIRYRTRKKLTIQQRANQCQVSCDLLMNLEQYEGYVTHPKIVKRVAAAYRLTDQQAACMLPMNYRPGPDYDPGRYVIDASQEWKS